MFKPLPTCLISIPDVWQWLLRSLICLLDSERSFSGKNNLPFNGRLPLCKKRMETSIKNIFKKCRGMWGWPCQKLQKLGVGMAVCRQDMLYKDYTTNPIPTSFLLAQKLLYLIISLHNSQNDFRYKKRCRDGVTCVVFV